jgi:DNA-binding response OmpR family regulator
MRVLIVEDNANTLEMLKTLLERQGYVVDHAATGRWARTMLSLPPPDVVLLDLLLPADNGADLLAEMRRCPGWERVPAILETAASEEDLAALDLVHLAPVRVLRKPYDPEQMLALLAQIKGGSRP